MPIPEVLQRFTTMLSNEVGRGNKKRVLIEICFISHGFCGFYNEYKRIFINIYYKIYIFIH